MSLISSLGFPRKMDQAIKFDESVCPSRFTLFFDCNEEVMLQRLLNRGKTSGRADDNEESIKKRFKTFVETSMFISNVSLSILAAPAGSIHIFQTLLKLTRRSFQGMPVIEYFEKQGKVVRVVATQKPDEVYESVKKAMKERGVI